MRLKFLFFPVILLVSLLLFITNIWPAIGDIKRINEEELAKNAQLKAIVDKQAAIESLGNKISDNVEGEDFVNNYLPKNKIEERIISGVNYLAGDANVSLVNITLTGAKNVSTATAGTLALNPVSPIDPITGQPIVSNENTIQSTSAKISLIGDYAKIRIFLDGLQRMPIFNVVKSVNITKQKNVATTDATAAATDSSLSAEILVDFGYLGSAVANNAQVENFKPGIDNDTIESLKSYVSQKSQSVDTGTDAKGKTNPFLAN